MPPIEPHFNKGGALLKKAVRFSDGFFFAVWRTCPMCPAPGLEPHGGLLILCPGFGNNSPTRLYIFRKSVCNLPGIPSRAPPCPFPRGNSTQNTMGGVSARKPARNMLPAAILPRKQLPGLPSVSRNAYPLRCRIRPGCGTGGVSILHFGPERSGSESVAGGAGLEMPACRSGTAKGRKSLFEGAKRRRRSVRRGIIGGKRP